MHERIGERRLSNRFGWMEVIKWEGNKKVTVKFDDHPNEVVCQWTNFKDGLVTAYPHKPKTILNNLKSLLINMTCVQDSVVLSSRVDCFCLLCKTTTSRTGSSLISHPYCKSCANESEKTSMLSQLHNPYKYIEWDRYNTTLFFNCSWHGEYKRKLKESIGNEGCSRCALDLPYVQEKLKEITKNILHNTPINMRDKVGVTCIVCGDKYSANLKTLLHKGRGCKKCRYASGREQRVTFEVFKERTKNIYGYSYDESSWKSIGENISITHLECGRTFSQAPSMHLNGNYGKPVGCPYCATHGFSLGRNGSVYVLYEEVLGLTKVGVTHQPVKRRVMQIRANSLRKYNVDVDFKLIDSWEMSGEKCAELERTTHKFLETSFDKPAILFDGSTECFKCSPENAINFIKNF